MSGYRLAGGRCLVSGDLAPFDIDVVDDRIDAIHPTGGAPTPTDNEIDVAGRIVAPGFVDVQCNGAGGFDITSDPRSIGDVAAALVRWGVTSFCPTVVTSDVDTRRAAIDACENVRRGAVAGADVIGLHLEGPALSHDHLGTHDARFVGVPTDEEIGRWCTSGQVALVTLAPERSDLGDMIDRLAAAGIRVAAGHSAASLDEIRAARQQGVTMITHLFNAMPGLHHRRPGIVGAALSDTDLFVGLVCDGVHVDPTVLEIAWTCLGSRTVLVTDASAALGASDGQYRIGSASIRASGGRVVNESGALAGSALSMAAAVRNLVAHTSATPVEALAAAATAPADMLGLTDRGRLEPGRRADLVVLSDDLEPVATYVNGILRWES